MPKKYYPALIVSIISFAVNLALTTVFTTSGLPQFALIFLGLIVWAGGVIGCSFVIPSLGAPAAKADIIWRFRRIGLFTVLSSAINLAVSFAGTFVVMIFIGGAFMKADMTDLAVLVTGAVNYALFLAIMRYLLLRIGYTDTGDKRFNKPFLLISMINVYSLVSVFVFYDCYAVKSPRVEETTVLFSNAHAFIAELFRSLPHQAVAALSIVWTAVISAVSIYIALQFYKSGRKRFYRDHPNTIGYDDEYQKQVYWDR